MGWNITCGRGTGQEGRGRGTEREVIGKRDRKVRGTGQEGRGRGTGRGGRKEVKAMRKMECDVVAISDSSCSKMCGVSVLCVPYLVDRPLVSRQIVQDLAR